ncbi:hypothetical protein KHQ81_04860 [Mycoplasmatota bacterium]|nr:hypothetical protein KHQ81_04860 [Mycoplasmatota bacterium]
MKNYSQALINHIESNYNLKIIQISPINEVLKIKTNQNHVYVLKKVKKREIIQVYYFLLSQKFTHFVMPEKTVYNQIFTSFENQLYYMIPYFDDIDYPIDKKLIDYIDLLNKLHKSTTIRKHFNRPQFNKLFKKKLKRLDKQFQLLDLYIIECENKKYKSIFDWTYLVKYNEIMYIKNILLKLQSQIENLVDDIDNYDYCIIHNNPSIDHFIVTNEKNYLISFDHSTIGFKVHDYIKLFIDYSEYEVDWMTLIINDKITNFEFNYFIFNVLYYIVKNIEITFLSNNKNLESINTLIHNLFVCAKAIELYQKYESVNSSSEEQE